MKGVGDWRDARMGWEKLLLVLGFRVMELGRCWGHLLDRSYR